MREQLDDWQQQAQLVGGERGGNRVVVAPLKIFVGGGRSAGSACRRPDALPRGRAGEAGCSEQIAKACCARCERRWCWILLAEILASVEESLAARQGDAFRCRAALHER